MTDPVTGVPAYRGEFDYLERRVQKQHSDIRELLNKLRALGQDVSGYITTDEETERYEAWKNMKGSDISKPWEWEERHLGPDKSQLKSNKDTNSTATNIKIKTEPMSYVDDAKCSSNSTFLPRNFVGVSDYSTQRTLGSRLNVLGWELDLSIFTGEEDNSTELPNSQKLLYDRSFKSFIATTHGLQTSPPIADVKMPTRQEAFNLALLVLHTSGAFTPIVHKPTFINLVSEHTCLGAFWR